MRLLIITQKVSVEDPVLGFFHRWIIQFAKNFEKITVICLEKGSFDLPDNVNVYSLGKEAGYSKLRILFRFFYLVFSKRHEYDLVLVHMNPIYLVLSGFLWKIMGKDMFLWYTHKSVDLKLRVASMFPRKIFSASSESFRLKKDNLIVTGHGIDVSLFKPDYSKRDQQEFRILSVGRISRTKSYNIFFQALLDILEKGANAKLVIVGGPLTSDDQKYYQELKKEVDSLGLDKRVEFVGPVSNPNSVKYFQGSDVFVHSSETGSLDKVVLESMACGTPVISSNDSAVPIVSKFNSNSVFEKGNSGDLSKKILYFSNLKGGVHNLQEKIRDEVVRNHNVEDLVKKISEEMKSSV